MIDLDGSTSSANACTRHHLGTTEGRTLFDVVGKCPLLILIILLVTWLLKEIVVATLFQEFVSK